MSSQTIVQRKGKYGPAGECDLQNSKMQTAGVEYTEEQRSKNDEPQYSTAGKKAREEMREMPNAKDERRNQHNPTINKAGQGPKYKITTIAQRPVQPKLCMPMLL